MLGWNERRTVCESKYIDYADKNAKDVGCSAENVVDTFAYFSCPFVESSVQTFTPCMFNVQAGMACDDPNSLADVVSFQSVSAQQLVEMLQCTESCSEEKDRDGRKYTRCHYKMDWSSQHISSGGFRDYGLAQSQCQGFEPSWGNPAWPSNFASGSQTLFAAGTVLAGDASHPFTIPKTLLAELTPDTVVQIPSTSVQGSLDANPQARPLRITKANSIVVGSFLQTCNSDSLGCVRISYQKSGATNPSILAHVASGGLVEPQAVPSSWLCEESQKQWIEKSKLSFKAFIEVLHSKNNFLAWVLRLVGVAAAWISVYCIFSPLTTAVDLIGDVINFVPCVGGFIEDLIEGAATCLVCVLSCGIGCSCAFFVIAVVWVAMRPLVGTIMFILACCCFFGGVAIVHSLRGDTPKKNRRNNEHKYLNDHSDQSE
jgi:hypothetical protein